MKKESKAIIIRFESFNIWLREFKCWKFLNKLSALIYPLLITLLMFLDLNLPLIVISALISVPHFCLLTFSHFQLRKIQFYKYIYKSKNKISQGEHIIKKKKYHVNIENETYIFNEIKYAEDNTRKYIESRFQKNLWQK